MSGPASRFARLSEQTLFLQPCTIRLAKRQPRQKTVVRAKAARVYSLLLPKSIFQHEHSVLISHETQMEEREPLKT
jgi:hypothetical protein